MPKAFRVRRGRLLVVAAVLGALAGAGALSALATTRAVEGSVIQACRGKISGLLRVVSDPSKCTRRELPISWNIQGPAGATGPAGPQGATGDPGPAGSQGD